MKKIFYPWNVKKPSDRYEKADSIALRCGFNLSAWMKNVTSEQKKIVAEIFKKLKDNPWMLFLCDDAEMIESLYELIPLTYITSELKFADSFTTHGLIDIFERGDYEDDVTRFANEFTRNDMILWIYPSARYRKFYHYESRIVNLLSDRAAEKNVTVFLMQSEETLRDEDALIQVYDRIRKAVGDEIKILIRNTCGILEKRLEVERRLDFL